MTNSNTAQDTARTARRKWYEIHAEHDDHVSGYGDRGTAEEHAEELTEEMGQDHYVVEVER